MLCRSGLRDNPRHWTVGRRPRLLGGLFGEFARCVCLGGVLGLLALPELGCRGSTPPGNPPPTPPTSLSTAPGDSASDVMPLCPSAEGTAFEADVPRATEDPNKRALLIGINDYEYDDIPDLKGTHNDVAAMHDVLVRRFGFAESNVMELLDGKATRDGIFTAIRSHLLQAANSSSVVVLYFSGHGSQMRDASREEADGWDETLVTQDSSHAGSGENRDISDDEVKGILSELAAKAGQVTMVSDSCHSGTVARSLTGTPRLAPPDERAAPSARSRYPNQSTAGLFTPTARYALISGARADEYSYEKKLDGETRGALTYYLVTNLWRARADWTYRDVMARVAADVTTNFPAQHPQLEGLGQDTELFGRREWTVQPTVDASVSNGVIQLSVGAIHGATAGSEFGVYLPGTKRFPPNAPIKVALVNVGTTTSTARVVSGAGTIMPGSRAVQLSTRYAGARLTVHLGQGADGPTLTDVRERLKKQSQVELVDDATRSGLRVTEQAGAVRIDQGTDGFSTLVPAAGTSAITAQQATKQILAWAKWTSIHQLESPHGPGNRQSPARLDVVAAQTPVKVGQTVRLRVKSTAEAPLYMSLLALSYDGGISVIFPVRGAVEQLAPGQTWEREVVTSLSDQRREVAYDRVKLFVSDQPHDLRFLEQEPQPEMQLPRTRSTGMHCVLPFESQLGTSALGITRGLTPAPSASTVGWYTEEAVVAIAPLP